MFFADPRAIREPAPRAARGSAAFVCWRRAREPWMAVPFPRARDCHRAAAPPAPGAPGPFSFGERGRVNDPRTRGFEIESRRTTGIALGGGDRRRGEVHATPDREPAARDHAPRSRAPSGWWAGACAVRARRRVALPGAVWVVGARSPG
jgi:hypothetical protein